MGQTKQLLPFEDRALLQHAIDNALDSGLDELVLVLGHDAQAVRNALELRGAHSLRVRVNDHHDEGQSTSLRLGLEDVSASATAAAVLLGDQPHVCPALIDRIVAAFFDAKTPIVRPVFQGADGRATPGHPVVLAREVFGAAQGLEGDEGARALLRQHPEWLTEVPIAGAAPADVDTWQDYQELRGSERAPST